MKLSFLILAHCKLSSKTPMRLEHQRGTAVSLYGQSPPKRADSIFLFLPFPPNRTMLKILLPRRGLILKDPRYLSLPIICRTKISQSKKKKKTQRKMFFDYTLTGSYSDKIPVMTAYLFGSVRKKLEFCDHVVV